MTHGEIRGKFLKFFEDRGHKIVPSSPLSPTDPSVLFTTAGMQQFKSYYTDSASAPAKNVASIQKCLRTSDIDEVGDDSHLTFFEMLGNFSFGGYWKKEAIAYAHEFITKELGLKIDHVSVFKGLLSAGIPADEESEKIWQSLDSKIIVKNSDIHDNFWGPTGSEGPCGPTTEICINGVEIWNLVFNEFYYPGSRDELLLGKNSKKLEKLKTSGIDTGMGLDRLVAVIQGKNNIFETDLLQPIAALVPSELDARTKRVVTDHSRAIAFLITGGVRPSNKEQGYVLRRLMRRVMTYFYATPVDNRLAKSVIHRSDSTVMHDIFAKIVKIYGPIYPELNVDMIIHEFDREKERFERALINGKKELKRIYPIKGIDPENPPPGTKIKGNTLRIPGSEVYKIYESTGLHPELAQEIMKSWGVEFDQETLREAEKIHQEKSRTGAKKKFGGHGLLLETGELKASNEEELKKVTRLHTATHLLHASLRKVLDEEVKQAGSDITAERLRFDFTFPRKLTPEEIKRVEDMVNDAVQRDYQVTKEEMSYEDAIKSGALAFFKLKYPPIVNVFTIGGTEPAEVPFSRELCGGPHVSHTSEIGKFKITKEEAVSAGVRRMRATTKS